MKTVAMALFPDFLLFDMAGPLEVFSITRFTEHRINPVQASSHILVCGVAADRL
ncbi:hypothetical protein [Pseudomonas sp. B22129]|uniref:hypothetical protein n=1 Tax=Pseudomonas sp. B22129 TaxID=3235111 RepID=UPI0037834B00